MLLWMEQINKEVVRMTGTDVRAKLAKFFSVALVDNILKLVRQSKLNNQLLDVSEAAGKAMAYDEQCMYQNTHSKTAYFNLYKMNE